MEKSKTAQATVEEISPSAETPEQSRTYTTEFDTALPKWPTQPQPLRRSKASRILSTAYDCALILAPLLLITKAGLCVLAHRHDSEKSGSIADPPSSLTEYMLRFNGQLVTLYTIIFVTIIATFVKRYALWKAQNGAAVATLEQFQASISLTSTIKMIFLLRAFRWSSLALLFIWSWYYLGSQAAEREYSWVSSESKQKRTIFFQNAEANTVFSNPSDLTSVVLSDISANFLGNFITGNPSRPDIFNGARFPILIQQSDSAIKPVKSLRNPGWSAIQDVYETDFASQMGTLFYLADCVHQSCEPSDTWLGSFDAAKTSYVYANCTMPVVGHYSDFPSGVGSDIVASFNATNVSLPGVPQIDAWFRSDDRSIRSTCGLHKHVIELQGNCDATGCAVTKFRKSPGTNFADPAPMFQDKDFTQRFLDSLLLVNGRPTKDFNDPFGNNHSFIVEASGAWKKGQNWTNNSSELAARLSSGMTILLNTYIAASQPYSAYNTGVNISAIINNHTDGKLWVLGHGKGATYWPHYKLSYAWMAVDIMTSFILLCAASAALWLRLHTFAPDVFGYVSSMTRDNPHVHLPEGGTTLSGVDRARALKHVKVRIADLGQGEVGRIGLVANDAEAKVLNEERQYV